MPEKNHHYPESTKEKERQKDKQIDQAPHVCTETEREGD